MLESLLQFSTSIKTVSVNFIINLSSSKWQNKMYNTVMILVKSFIKFVIYILCCKNMNAFKLVKLLYDCLFDFFDMSKNLMSDQNILFISKFWSSLCYYLEAKHRLLIAYYLQTDRQTEHQNQILKHYLQVYINYLQNNWTC